MQLINLLTDTFRKHGIRFILAEDDADTQIVRNALDISFDDDVKAEDRCFMSAGSSFEVIVRIIRKQNMFHHFKII